MSISGEKVLADKIAQFKDIDLTPEEFGLKIQGDRAIYIINRCLAKLNTLAYLPYLLLNDAEIIKKYLKPSETYFILNVFCEWGLIFDTTNIRPKEYIADYLRLGTVNKGTRKQQTPAGSLPENFPNPYVYQLVDLLFYNKCIQSTIRRAKTPKLDKHILGLIRYVQQLKEIAKSKVYVTGEQQMRHEQNLRRVYKINISLNVTVEELKQKLQKQREELGKQLEEKLKIVENYELKKETVIENFRIEIKRTLRDSENEMMQKCLESEYKQVSLAEQAEEIVKKYENIRKFDLEEENKARGKRLKIETQLQNWINTYDQDSTEKQSTWESLMAEYNDIKAQKDNMDQMLADQDIVYTTSMREKAEEEERIFNEMAYQFYLHRCAKKIQKYWRLFVAKRMTMKKKKRKRK